MRFKLSEIHAEYVEEVKRDGACRTVPDPTWHTALSSRVIAVLSIRVDGWCVYVDAVSGQSHSAEWRDVLRHGTKVKESVAKAIAGDYFHPGFECDLRYAE
jgi:hypothetical protein